MALALPISMKSGSLLLCVVGTAVGLNLSVMGIGAQSASTEQPITTTSPPADPEVRQVLVDVPVPMNEATTDASAAPAQAATPAPAPAAPAPAPAPTPAAPTTAQPATAPPAPAAAPPTTAPPATPQTTTIAPSTTAPSTSATPTTAGSTTEYLYYTFDGVAEIIVAYHDGQTLEFWSATTESGWAFMVEKDTADKIELKFRRVSGGEGEAKFELIRRDGQLVVKKER